MALSKRNAKRVREIADELIHLEELIRPHDPLAAQDVERARRELLFSDSHLTKAVAELLDE